MIDSPSSLCRRASERMKISFTESIRSKAFWRKSTFLRNYYVQIWKICHRSGKNTHIISMNICDKFKVIKKLLYSTFRMYYLWKERVQQAATCNPWVGEDYGALMSSDSGEDDVRAPTTTPDTITTFSPSTVFFISLVSWKYSNFPFFLHRLRFS